MGMGERPVAKAAPALAKPRVNHTFGQKGNQFTSAAGRFFPAPQHPAEHCPELPRDIAFLAQAGMSKQVLERAAKIATGKGLAASEVLFARGYLNRATYLEMLAEQIGARFGQDMPANCVSSLVGQQTLADPLQPAPIMLRSGEHRHLYLHAGPELASRLLSMPAGGTARRLVLTSSAKLRLARLSMLRQAYVRRASRLLPDRQAMFSAHYRFSRGQCLAMVSTIVLCALLGKIAPTAFGLAIALAMSGFYLALVLLRALLIWRIDDLPPAQIYRPKPIAAEDLPNYSIFVAMYHEAGQVRELVKALSRLDWPSDKREVYLVCEQDDPKTINAIKSITLPPGFHLVTCPGSHPRTKPKALNFALPLADGKFTVIYDAEDRPHPLQLREAYECFNSGDGKLACLQAPLAISNRHQNWLTGMFGLEYQTLFGGTLPLLAWMGGPIPLGGTSNHFRTDILRQCGGWDAWNVTEDADLGIRLARLGYKCGTLSLPTWEAAPDQIGVWMRQRTRWLKGWMQTILVHTRNPALLHRQLGLRGSLLFHLFLTSIVVSALIHPFFLATMAVRLSQMASGQALTLAESSMLGLSVFNLAAGYTSYGFFAMMIAQRSGHPHVLMLIMTLPLYWLLISLAAWRALWHLLTKPFNWEKTEHGLAKSTGDANMQ